MTTDSPCEPAAAKSLRGDASGHGAELGWDLPADAGNQMTSSRNHHSNGHSRLATLFFSYKSVNSYGRLEACESSRPIFEMRR